MGQAYGFLELVGAMLWVVEGNPRTDVHSDGVHLGNFFPEGLVGVQEFLHRGLGPWVPAWPGFELPGHGGGNFILFIWGQAPGPSLLLWRGALGCLGNLGCLGRLSGFLLDFNPFSHTFSGGCW